MIDHREENLIHSYRRFPITFVSGEGCILKDDVGKEYLDCLAGLAVVNVGHSNPAVAEAISVQAKKLTHVSNYFYNDRMLRLADELNRISGATANGRPWRSFFCNSGAEANECALKLVRKSFAKRGAKAKCDPVILCASRSFHGRTLGALAATGQPAKWEGFEPLPSGFVHLEFNNLAAFEAAVNSDTSGRIAGIMVEPIQGEGGVIPATLEFLQGLRKLCLARGIALIFDEVQSGVGRTGSWWAFQGYGVTPDCFTVAKGIANGLPLGICVVSEPWASIFGPGDHASTFGGNPLVCSAALATLDFMDRSGTLSQVSDKGSQLSEGLSKIPHVVEVRGRGLMLAAVLDAPVAQQVVERAALENGLLINAVLPEVVRFVPPLTISTDQIGTAIRLFQKTIEEIYVEPTLP